MTKYSKWTRYVVAEINDDTFDGGEFQLNPTSGSLKMMISVDSLISWVT